MGGLTPAELARIRGRLEAFAEDLFASLPRADQRARGQCYLRGLVLDGRRKSIEPMAARLGEVHYQALHHFVATSPWDWRPVRQRLAEQLCAALEPTAWWWTTPAFPKTASTRWGAAPVLGHAGQDRQLPAGVSVDAVTEHASCPLDWRLFVPESWDDDTPASQQRRAACHLPEQVHHRPKWQLVLDMLDELGGWQLHPPVLLADSGYGRSGSSAGGWRSARSPTWWRSAPTPAPTPNTCTLPLRRMRARGAVPGRATATSRPRLRNWPWRSGSRPAWSLSGGGAARACNAAGSWRCGCVRRGHATPAGTSGRQGAAGALAAGRVAGRQG